MHFAGDADLPAEVVQTEHSAGPPACLQAVRECDRGQLGEV